MKFKNMNLPNKLTTIRMFLVIVMILFFFLHLLFLKMGLNTDLVLFNKSEISNLTLLQVLMAIVFALASFTDYLDGHIARKNNITSDYGKLMDPLADKLLVNTTIIFMLASNKYNIGTDSFRLYEIIAITFSIIVIVRDIFVDALRMQALKKNVVVAASFYGKLKTATLMPGVIILLIGSVNYIVYAIGLTLMIFGGIFALIGGIDYFKQISKYIED